MISANESNKMTKKSIERIVSDGINESIQKGEYYWHDINQFSLKEEPIRKILEDSGYKIKRIDFINEVYITWELK